MRGRSPLIISLVLGLIAGIVAYSAIRKREHDLTAGLNPVPVLVVAQDVSEGTVLTPELIAIRSIPETFVTSSVVKPDSSSYVIGQKVQVAMQKGDPLFYTQLDTGRASQRLSNRIIPNMRSLTIEAKGVHGAGGFVLPNDHVDIIGTFKDPDNGKVFSQVLLQNITVLAAGKMTVGTNLNLLSESQRDYGSVSLLVVPEELEVLTLAQETGSLTLALRGGDDPSMIAERGRTDVRAMLEGERLHNLDRTRTSRTIDVIRGSGSTKAVAQ